MEKKCAHCSVIFFASKFCADRVRYCSKKCAAAARRNNPQYRKAQSEFQKEYRKKNAANAKIYMAKWRAEHPGYSTKRYQKNKERMAALARESYRRNSSNVMDRRRLKLYGISPEEFAAMRTAQNERCAICEVDSKDKRLVIDHHHESGTVRKLICDHCNALVGILENHPEKLMSCMQYLHEHRLLPEYRLTKIVGPAEFK